jgi:Thaumatin family
VTIPILSTGTGDTVWSGNLWAGTDVDSGPSRTIGTVATGYCKASQNGMDTIIPCDAFTGSQNAPLTKAEFAFVNSTDFYDLTLLHGANVPISMEPTSGQNFGPVPPGSPNQKYYWCTAPGSVSKSPTALCDWVFKPPTNNVTNNGPGLALVQHQQMPTLCGGPNQTCPPDAHGKAQVCGLAFDFSKGTSGIYQECGNNSDRGGTWSAIQICTAIDYNKNNLNPNQVSTQFMNSFNCGTGAASPGNAQLFQCIGPNIESCYVSAATTDCCGCPNWPPEYKPNVTSKTGNPNAPNACYSTNPNWASVSGAWLTYIKQACPSVYSYQYDDVTSTFTCSTVPNTAINATNYTITFCPDHLRALVE